VLGSAQAASNLPLPRLGLELVDLDGDGDLDGVATVSGDLNGDGRADFTLVVHYTGSLDASDFIL
jgi:hypothetical protein